MHVPVFVHWVIVTVCGILSSGLANGEMNSKSFTIDSVVLMNADQRTRRLEELVAINKAEVDSKTFALVDNYDCDNDMVVIVQKFFKVNNATFSTCVSDSGYELYPYRGILPDSRIMTDLVNSNACMGIITAVILLDMPPCLMENLAMRAACETILEYSIRMHNGAVAPSVEQFNKVMTWRQIVILAKAAKKPCDDNSEMFAVFNKNLNEALGMSKVKVMDNYTVVLDHEKVNFHGNKDGTQPSFVSTNSFMDFFAGKVVAHKDDTHDALIMAAASDITRQSSDSMTVAATSMSGSMMTLMLVAAFL